MYTVSSIVLLLTLIGHNTVFMSPVFPVSYTVTTVSWSQKRVQNVFFVGGISWRVFHVIFYHLCLHLRFIQTNLPQVGFEHESLGQQVNMLPLSHHCLHTALKVFLQKIIKFKKYFRFFHYCRFKSHSYDLNRLWRLKIDFEGGLLIWPSKDDRKPPCKMTKNVWGL